MKLRNKKTGEIGDLMGSERSCHYITIDIDFHDGNPIAFEYTSLNQLNEEWEDAPEPSGIHRKRFRDLRQSRTLWRGERMRELKFRAWDKDGVEYVDGVGKLYVDILEVGTKVFRIEQMCPGRYILEQYTGLKDENGKEIYEGDIVTLNGEWEEIEHDDCSIVTFENGCFRVGDGYENDAGSYLSDWRVIGNIHENPELLGDTNITNKEEE